MRAVLLRTLAAPSGWPIHLCLAGLLLSRATLLGEALFARDLHVDWYPRALVIAETLRSGLPPLWDLSIGFGQPLLGDPSAQVLYPTTWLAPLLAPWSLYTLYAVLHLVLAGTGMTRLARAAGLRRPAAVAAGAAWMLGGPLASLVDLWHHLAGAAWMPWVVLAVHRAARRPGARPVARLGACLGLQVLAGSADMVLLTAGVSAAWLAAVAPRRPSRLRGGAVRVTAGVALAALLSAGQWLPAVDLASRGVRRHLPPEQAAQWSVPPAGFVRTLVPLEASGRLALGPRAQLGLFDSARPPFLGSLYVGVGAWALAGAALLASRRRRVLPWLAVVAAAAALVALGKYSPVHGVAAKVVPGLEHLRYPSKAMVAFGFAAALLAGMGLEALRREPRARRVAGRLAAAGAAVLAVAAVLFGPGVSWAIGLGLLLDREGAAGDALVQASRLLAGAALAALAAGLLLRPPVSRRALPVAGLVAACLVADLLLAHHDLHATAPAALLVPPPPVLSAVDRAGHGRVYVYDYMFLVGASERHLGRAMPYAIAQPPPGFDPRPWNAFAQRVYPVPPVSGTWGVEGSFDLDLRGLQPLPQWGLCLSLRGMEGTPGHRRLLQAGAVRTVISLHTGSFGDLEPGPVFPSLFPEPIRTWRVPDPLPRAYVAGRARVLDGREAIRAMVDPGFDPASEVVLSGPGAERAAAVAGGGGGKATIRDLRADRVDLDVELDAPGLVVTVDAWDSGWLARVDGLPVEVLRANVAFRAVAVPAGRHRVEMRYRPRSVLLGLALSGIAVFALLGVATLDRRLPATPGPGEPKAQ